MYKLKMNPREICFQSVSVNYRPFPSKRKYFNRCVIVQAVRPPYVFVVNNCCYYIASSASGQGEPNRAL